MFAFEVCMIAHVTWKWSSSNGLIKELQRCKFDVGCSPLLSVGHVRFSPSCVCTLHASVAAASSSSRICSFIFSVVVMCVKFTLSISEKRFFFQLLQIIWHTAKRRTHRGRTRTIVLTLKIYLHVYLHFFFVSVIIWSIFTWMLFSIVVFWCACRHRHSSSGSTSIINMSDNNVWISLVFENK